MLVAMGLAAAACILIGIFPRLLYSQLPYPVDFVPYTARHVLATLGLLGFTGLGFFLLGAGPILWVISTTTLRQSVTPPRLLGRVSAINIMSYGARPLGAGIGALAGGLAGAEACLYVAVAGFAVQMMVILMSQAVGLARQPEMAAD